MELLQVSVLKELGSLNAKSSTAEGDYNFELGNWSLILSS